MEPDAVDGGAGLVGNEPVAQDTTPVGSEQAPTGDNPAWGELLGVLPSSLHGQVKPFLEKWDKGVNDRFTQVQSKYSPYNEFLSVDPQQIQASLQLAQMIATDPRGFYDRMTNHYGSEWGLADQGQQDTDSADDYSLDGLDDEEGDDLANNPLIQQLKEQQDTIANFLASQVQREQEAAQQAAVEDAGKQIQTELGNIATKYAVESIPPQAEKMMISLALQNEGMTLEQAAEEVMPLFAAQGRPQAPRIIAPGGGVPSNNLDTAKMGKQDTVSLVTQMLAQANANK
jgi:hypothetical protein